MSKNTLTLVLEGDISLDNFAKALKELNGLIEELSKELAPGINIEWIIEQLFSSSANTTVQGIALEPEPIERIINAYETIGEYLSKGDEVPYSSPIRQRVQSLTNVINENITAMRLQTEGTDWFVSTRATEEGKIPKLNYNFGTVKGRAHSLTDRKKLSFTLWDSLFDKPVTCYFSEEQNEIVRNIWRKKVVISGRIGRNHKTGFPVIIRDITDITIIEDVEPGSYKRAKGAMPWKEEDELPEEIIRKLRDA